MSLRIVENNLSHFELPDPSSNAPGLPEKDLQYPPMNSPENAMLCSTPMSKTPDMSRGKSKN